MIGAGAGAQASGIVLKICYRSSLVYLAINGASSTSGTGTVLEAEVRLLDNCKSLKSLSLSLSKKEKYLKRIEPDRPSTKLRP